MELIISHRGTAQRIEVQESTALEDLARMLEDAFSVSSNSAIKLLVSGRKGAVQLSDQPERTLKQAGARALHARGMGGE
jgi:hypothetical protein